MKYFTKRSALTKGGSIFVGLALSFGANAMDQQGQAPVKSGATCAPVDERTVHVPENFHLGAKEENKTEHERLTVTENVTTRKTREHHKWETMGIDYADLPPIMVKQTVTTWTKERRKPCEKAIKTTVVKQEKPCLTQTPVKEVKEVAKADCALDTQCQAPAPVVVKEPLVKCDQAPVQVEKVATKVSKVEPMCGQVSQVVPSNCPPCGDLLSRDALQRVSTLNWFHHHAHAKNFLVEQKAFGHSWSFGDKRTIDWDKTQFSCGIFDNFAASSIDAHHARWDHIQFLGGDSELMDVEFHGARLRDSIFRGDRHNRLKLASVSFRDARLTNVVFENVKFDHSAKKRWRKTSFKNAKLKNVTFNNVDFEHVTFKGAIFKPGAQLGQCASGKPMVWNRFIGAQVWMGKGQKYNVITQASIDQMAKNCQKGFGYEQLRQYSQAQQR